MAGSRTKEVNGMSGVTREKYHRERQSAEQNLNTLVHLSPSEKVSPNTSSTKAGLFAWASYSSESRSEYIPQKVASRDRLFLFGILLLSGLSYVNRLGFYADDWYVWSAFHGASDQSIGGLLRALPLSGSLLDGLGVRPAQTLYQALTYSSFGLHPLPYHLFNTLVLAGIVSFGSPIGSLWSCP
jgi:hypothetical protein